MIHQQQRKHRLRILFFTLLFTIVISSHVKSQGFLHADGQRIVNGKGENVLLRGMGLGGLSRPQRDAARIGIRPAWRLDGEVGVIDIDQRECAAVACVGDALARGGEALALRAEAESRP